MAKIWPVYEGRVPTIGHAWAEMPIDEAVTLFDIRPENFVSDLSRTPRFGNVDADLTYRGFKYIIVEIGRAEGKKANWRSGFYLSPVRPSDAFDRLLHHAVSAELGAGNVVRVEHQPTVDSQGREALKIIIVIPSEATELLREGALDALVRLQARLREMGEVRTPIVEYATEAELAQDVGP